jgi:lipid A 3-O-deacylase
MEMVTPLSAALALALAPVLTSRAIAHPFDASDSSDLIAHASDGFHFTPASAACVSTSPAGADAAAPDSSRSLADSLARITLAAQAQTDHPTTATQPAGTLELPPRTSSNPYFTQGSWRWQLTAALSSDFHDVSHAMGGIGWSYFLERDLTIDFEVNGLFISQEEGSDTGALNMAMLLRWHFKIDDAQRWSLYTDAGIGFLYAGSDVPKRGSSFNFTPQLGIGASFLIDESNDTRLLTGLRWHHISNANTFEDNRGVDALMLYAGINFPF